jgi:hypothetical protein
MPYANGVLTFISRGLRQRDELGVLAIAARQQELAQYIAADFAPDDGRSSRRAWIDAFRRPAISPAPTSQRFDLRCEGRRSL